MENSLKTVSIHIILYFLVLFNTALAIVSHTCDIETALAQKAQKMATMDTALKLKPRTETDVVLTYFWVDNFDILVERHCGGGGVS